MLYHPCMGSPWMSMKFNLSCHIKHAHASLTCIEGSRYIVGQIATMNMNIMYNPCMGSPWMSMIFNIICYINHKHAHASLRSRSSSGSPLSRPSGSSGNAFGKASRGAAATWLAFSALARHPCIMPQKTKVPRPFSTSTSRSCSDR